MRTIATKRSSAIGRTTVPHAPVPGRIALGRHDVCLQGCKGVAPLQGLRFVNGVFGRLNSPRGEQEACKVAVDKDVVGPTTFVKRCLGGIDKRIGGQLEKRSVVRKIVEEAHVVGWWW